MYHCCTAFRASFAEALALVNTAKKIFGTRWTCGSHVGCCSEKTCMHSVRHVIVSLAVRSGPICLLHAAVDLVWPPGCSIQTANHSSSSWESPLVMSVGSRAFAFFRDLAFFRGSYSSCSVQISPYHKHGSPREETARAKINFCMLSA